MNKSISDHVRELVKGGALDAALSLCEDELRDASESEHAAIWLLMAYVHRRMKDYEAAISDASRGLQLEPEDGALLFDRARTLIEMSQFSRASADLEILIAGELKRGSEWHLSAARLLQALCFTKLGRYADALNLCKLLPADASFRALNKVVTRAQLEEDALTKG